MNFHLFIYYFIGCESDLVRRASCVDSGVFEKCAVSVTDHSYPLVLVFMWNYVYFTTELLHILARKCSICEVPCIHRSVDDQCTGTQTCDRAEAWIQIIVIIIKWAGSIGVRVSTVLHYVNFEQLAVDGFDNNLTLNACLFIFGYTLKVGVGLWALAN